jgi:hypothetical protein
LSDSTAWRARARSEDSELHLSFRHAAKAVGENIRGDTAGDLDDL